MSARAGAVRLPATSAQHAIIKTSLDSRTISPLTASLLRRSAEIVPTHLGGTHIQAVSVVLSNPALGTSVTLFDVGDFGAPHDSGTCYWRFKPSGSPPKISVTFNVLPGSTPSDGCPDD